MWHIVIPILRDHLPSKSIFPRLLYVINCIECPLGRDHISGAFTLLKVVSQKGDQCTELYILHIYAWGILRSVH